MAQNHGDLAVCWSDGENWHKVADYSLVNPFRTLEKVQAAISQGPTSIKLMGVSESTYDELKRIIGPEYVSPEGDLDIYRANIALVRVKPNP